MNRRQAAQLLGIGEGASAAEANAAFLVKLNELDGRIQTAPSDALRQKYQDMRGELATALQVLAAMVMNKATLYHLKQGMKKYPQRMINVALGRPINVETSAPIQSAVKDVEKRLNGKGRVLLRSSGTEPLIRVMVEGEDEKLVNEQAAVLARVVEQTVNAQAESA